MKHKNTKRKFVAIIGIPAVLAFNFAVMPSVLAATPETSEIQTVTGNTVALNENSSAVQAVDYNAISEEQAVTNAMAALKSQGFDTKDFKDQPTEIRYIAETVPAGEPVWSIIFRDDQEGYAYAFGDDVNDETRDKLAAIGKVEACEDENGISGIRAHYSYTKYTLVEINALNGKYIRHGGYIAEFGKPLNMDETYWAPIAEEDNQEKLQQKS